MICGLPGQLVAADGIWQLGASQAFQAEIDRVLAGKDHQLSCPNLSV